MPAPTFSQLEAINAILRSVGQTGLVSYPSANADENELAATAALDEGVKKLSAREDFPWNVQGDDRRTIPLLTIAADGAGKIKLEPATVAYHVARVQLHPTDTDYPNKLVDVRSDGGVRRLYNVTDSTFVWGVGSSKTVQVTYVLDFDSLPAPAQDWCVARAKVIMAQSKHSDPVSLRIAAAQEADAWAVLLDWSARQEVPRLNILDGKDIITTTHAVTDPFSGGVLLF